jgi:hypothetical protein
MGIEAITSQFTGQTRLGDEKSIDLSYRKIKLATDGKLAGADGCFNAAYAGRTGQADCCPNSGNKDVDGCAALFLGGALLALLAVGAIFFLIFGIAH